MRLIQFLPIEITTVCNLGAAHKACPNMSPERWTKLNTEKPISDDKICEIVHEAYTQRGFEGAVAWHYYNEPLCAKERMLGLMHRIRAETPQARFCLWTNGELIDPEDCDYLDGFDMCWVTDYKGNQAFKHVKAKIRGTKVMRWQLDKRIDPRGSQSLKPCGRPFSEFIIDFFGNVHLCCIDWQGNVPIGNVWEKPLAELVDTFNMHRDNVALDMSKAHQFCQHCTGRHARVSDLIPAIAREGKRYLQGKRKGRPTFIRKSLPLLALAAVRGSGSAEEWRKHHEGMADTLEVFDDFTRAAKWLKRAGCYFGAIMTTGQRLSGPVQEAMALHPNENLLSVGCHAEDGTKLQSLVIARMRDVRGFAACSPTLKNRVTPIPITLAELSVLSQDVPKERSLAVTFVHYRLPEQRLKDHFRWNDALYREADARVFVVTDREYEVPEYAKCLVYPEKMERFNLAKTSNYGIRYAIDSGYGLICKTDADICFPEESFRAMTATGPHQAALPVYHMASSYAERDHDYVNAPNATGTICMSADDWRKAHFHEGCTGYGCDDGILRRLMKRMNIKEVRSHHVDHIAHIEGTPQKEFNKANPRVDHWNRDDGFNPENFAGNRGLERKPFTAPEWGLAGCERLTVVVTHYRLPRRRLDEFIGWNDELFRANRVRVIVVSDEDHDGLPDYCRCAVYPAELPMFNLSKTSNYGIRLAGSGIICKADPDNVFSQEAIDAMLAVTPTDGISPRFFMAKSFEARHESKSTWDASKGCLCLHWDHWQAIKGYDERCEGYGIEDGDCYHRAGKLEGYTAKRAKVPFWHIAHTTAKQARGNARSDCWNRSTGYNPRNHRDNCKAMQAGPWEDESWGLPTVSAF